MGNGQPVGTLALVGLGRYEDVAVRYWFLAQIVTSQFASHCTYGMVQTGIPHDFSSTNHWFLRMRDRGTTLNLIKTLKRKVNSHHILNEIKWHIPTTFRPPTTDYSRGTRYP